MLRELTVNNLAVIEDVRIELAAGFCAWTGETGAGKSLILGALGLLLGERGSPALIRTGTDELKVTGAFRLDERLRKNVEEVLEEAHPEAEIILSRRLPREGGSRAYVNDHPATVGTLKKLGAVLVDIHSQSESQRLLLASHQLELLDAFGNLAKLREAYEGPAGELRQLRKRAKELRERQSLRQRELALIRFEREELDAAQLVAGEEVALATERTKLLSVQKLRDFAARCADRLYGDDGSVCEQLGKLQKDAAQWAPLDARLAEVAKRFDALVPEVRDLADTCADLTERFEADPEQLDTIEHRFQLLKKLELKHRKPAAELIAHRDALADQERQLQKQEDDQQGIESSSAALFAQAQKAAKKLSAARAKVATQFAAETQKHLKDLGMPKAKLEARLETLDLPAEGDLPPDGADTLELLLTANPGEEAQPLRKVASGGELSRAMLAIKSVLAQHDPVGTLIFDEIDSNVGGRLGDVLGEKLRKLAETHQVICVTHLPQVAGCAGHQWTIRKRTQGNRTITSVDYLANKAARLEELATMLRGEARTDSTLREAEAMLRK